MWHDCEVLLKEMKSYGLKMPTECTASNYQELIDSSQSWHTIFRMFKGRCLSNALRVEVPREFGGWAKTTNQVELTNKQLRRTDFNPSVDLGNSIVTGHLSQVSSLFNLEQNESDDESPITGFGDRGPQQWSYSQWT
jgi:hypothetical protein